MKPFDYIEAGSVSEANSHLAEGRGRARVIAGGTDLYLLLKQERLRADLVINIRTIPGLDSIDREDEWIKLGALASLSKINRSPLIIKDIPVLASAAGQMANPGIRNVATVGGNLCNAAPSADLAPALIGLAARLKIIGLKNERTVSARDLFVGPGQSALEPDEILTEIAIPVPARETRSVFLKLPTRSASGLSVVSVGAVVSPEPDSLSINKVRIVLGAVGPTPLRAVETEKILSGNRLGEKVIEEAAAMAATEAKPISDQRASSRYRRDMVEHYTRRALNLIRADLKKPGTGAS